MGAKRAIKRAVPASVIQAGRRRVTAAKTHGQRRALRRAPGAPAWLDPELLPLLHDQYTPPTPYRYTDDALLQRGLVRSRELGRHLPRKGGKVLEVGAGDGMVSYFLSQHGAQATALDMSDQLIDKRAVDAGVKTVIGDASAIPVRDNTFDLAFSYNSFEHFADPAQVFGEVLRVVRPGGLVAVSFGPLYWSPYGLHAYKAISVPYCQVLWGRPVLEAFVAERQATAIPYESLNGWTPAQFRDLFHGRAEVRSYTERPNTQGAELMTRYPSCFVAKHVPFEALTLGIIEGVFRKPAGQVRK